MTDEDENPDNVEDIRLHRLWRTLERMESTLRRFRFEFGIKDDGGDDD